MKPIPNLGLAWTSLGVAALLALPAIASAHTATVTCDPASPGHYLVSATYQYLNPVTTFGATGATVTWSDRYVVTLPYPEGCTLPVPPVVPPVLDAPPQPSSDVSSPPVVVITPGAPEHQPVVKRATPKPRVIGCAFLNAHHAGPLRYTRRGLYFRCHTPRQVRITPPPVAG